MNVIQILDRLSSSDTERTHVSVHPRMGKYYIEPGAWNEFMKVYADSVIQGIDMGILEMSQFASPVLADVDIESDSKELEELYTHEQIRSVIQYFHNVFSKYIPETPHKHYTCVVMTKDPYWKEKDGKRVVKHGFHLHFPYIWFMKDDLKNHIYPEIKERVDLLFEENVFDDSIVKSPWFLYGSSKENREPYRVNRIYDYLFNVVSPEDALMDYPIYDGFGELIEYDTIEQPFEYYYPWIFSIRPQFREIETIKHIDVLDSFLVQQITTVDYHMDKDDFIPMADEEYADNLIKARRILPLLSARRASNYEDWMKVGWCLFNSCGPSLESLTLWIEFSQRTMKKNFNRQVCIEEWKKMHPGEIQIGTLYYYARNDSPEEYSKFIFEENKKPLYEALTGTHFDIAMFLYKEYKDSFRCTGIQGKVWFSFQKHTWRRTEDGTRLRNLISTDLYERFKQVKIDLSQRLIRSNDPGEIQARLKNVQKLLNACKNTSFKASVMRECCEVFYDEKFVEKLDCNPYLFAFKNGVYDLHKHIFRCGLPNDYISKTAAINYPSGFDEYHPEVQKAHLFLRQVFPDRDVRNYFINVMASLFRGGNYDKKIYIWSGEGDNGKSVTELIVERMLGEYCQKLPTSVIIGQRIAAGQADPNLSRTSGVRKIFIQEPGPRDSMNVGVLKELSGNDSFFARDLYQKGSDLREIHPLFKLALVCNKPPNIVDADKATWNRLRVIPFESTFVTLDKLPKTEEEQLAKKMFPVDRDFESKIPGMLGGFAWIFLEQYRKTGGVIGEEPEKVKMATNAYRSRNDLIRHFINDTVQKDPNGNLSLTALYEIFREWYQEMGYEKKLMPTKNDVKDRLVKMWGEPQKRNKWFGYSLLLEEDD